MSSPAPSPLLRRRGHRGNLEIKTSFTTNVSESILTLEDELAEALDSTFLEVATETGGGTVTEPGDAQDSRDRTAEVQSQIDKDSPAMTSTRPSSQSVHGDDSFMKINEEGLKEWRKRFEKMKAALTSETNESGGTHQRTTVALLNHASAIYNWLTKSVTPYLVDLASQKKTLQDENDWLRREIELLQDETGELLEAYWGECEVSRGKTSMLLEMKGMLDEIARTENQGEASVQI
ncbi:hypothetical protein HRR83_007651 [Exophiala dermatitidis]|uniref:Uncharacterized protein n=2 Tax=Exophiala dermatitidis TaxID=5970 RepID=H6BL51_EXODN|nr:uncharacterized protein HMPREF1120_01006 [Exophiala dermatitidis NIH/UT8656]KAJ4507819.1 hypothetical protein HRR75_006529 [Exophiala dermatitidis]EHY52799.1 hypothetical protein HMPREF1120_01006 [Exophiala dermatitidis NIH/UT8656]KAJ4509960.1 hypothetical protein HRR74_007112 [Exophiala dermatitidis]KAJ4521789.1 hypothetical protein HRR73_002987 [Exophiala dermatitidis]KAJ4539484.1 hypothetical protein HRR77_006367 [Exophiala dermatitidis]